MTTVQPASTDLFTPQGEAALAALLAQPALLAFDFDGTLAPIVDHPELARVPSEVAACMAQLVRRKPVAIITGRSVADVRARLDFTPHHIVGSHGAEGDFTGYAGAWQQALQGLRERLARETDLLRRAGVRVEDKGQSIALHYRLAPDRAAARHTITTLLRAAVGPELRVFGGKLVCNVVAAAAPDKADALQALVTHLHCRAALFVGDDINDEVVFQRAPAHWLTVKVGRDGPASRAQYLLAGQDELLTLLRRLLQLLG